MQSPSLQNPPKSSSQPEGEHIKKDKGKKAMSSEEAEKESTNSDSNDDETHLTGSMVESPKITKVKKFDFVTDAAKRKSEVRKEELVDLLGPEVVNKYYNDKLQYDKYCDKMLNRRAESRITNCGVLIKKGLITLKVYREDGTSKVIPNFKASDLHIGEWREVMNTCPNRTGKGWKIIYDQIHSRMDYIHTTAAELGINLDIPLSKQDPLDKFNDLANKKRKHVDDIHDYFKANKRLKLSIQYEDHLASTVLNEHVLGPLKIGKYLHFSLCSGSETKEGLCKELQFSLIDNSKLNIVYLLNRSLKRFVSLLEGLQGGKRLLYVKRNKAISLGKDTSKVGIEVQQLSLKDCTCLSSKEITSQLSFNHLAIPQARKRKMESRERKREEED
ncbi:hypothetical protein Tco_0325201 [Tanacetum coccineum]